MLTGLIAFATVVNGAIAVYIAWQQYKVNHNRLQFDFYERRIHVYRLTKEILQGLESLKEDSQIEPLRDKCWDALAEADFLFKQEIPEYLNELKKHISGITQENRGFAKTKKLDDQVKEKFAPYLHIEQPRYSTSCPLSPLCPFAPKEETKNSKN
ncbi:TPA: hypothetical protein DDW35_13670 [Candidatus Sumerlaeota bacterium]|nr:hypothetical protein [Candidatus Sumerlaeota bacterium]